MQRPRNVATVFFLILLAATVLVGRLLWEFASAIVLALVLVTLFQPLHRWLTRKLGGRDQLAAGLTTVLVLLGVVAPVTLFAVALSQQAYGLFLSHRDTPLLSDVVRLMSGESLPVQRVRELLEGIGLQVSADELEEVAGTLVKQVGLFLYERLSGFAADAFGIAMQFLAMILLVFTLLVRGERLKAFLMDLSPLPDDEEQQLIDRFKEISRAVFVGNGVGSLLQGVFGGIGFAVFGLGSAVIWGTAMGLLALLPVFGASVIFVPAAAYLFLSGKALLAGLFLAYNFAHVGLLEYGLKPKLIGNGSRMNAVLVFLSILGGLSLFGVLGIFYGPLIVAMFLAIVELYKTRYRKQQLRDAPPERRLNVQG